MTNNRQESSHTKISCAVITVSDSRNEATDKGGKLMIDLLIEANHQVNEYKIIPDEKDIIQQTIEQTIQRKDIEAVIVTGGTGISQRDVTIESIQPLFDKELPGFGELFRLLSYQLDIGSASMLSRGIAGVANNRIIFSTPGSVGAVKLAMEKLILPELRHTVKEINKDL